MHVSIKNIYHFKNPGLIAKRVTNSLEMQKDLKSTGERFNSYREIRSKQNLLKEPRETHKGKINGKFGQSTQVG